MDKLYLKQIVTKTIIPEYMFEIIKKCMGNVKWNINFSYDTKGYFEISDWARFSDEVNHWCINKKTLGKLLFSSFSPPFDTVNEKRIL